MTRRVAQRRVILLTKPALVSIYVLSNSTKKEFLVWIEDDGLALSDANLGSLRPAHWDAVDHVIAHTVESRLTRDDAPAFRDNYVKNMRQLPGWNVRIIGPGS